MKVIHNMERSKARNKLKRYLGLFNYYRDISQKSSELMTPLTGLSITKLQFISTKVEDEALEKI